MRILISFAIIMITATPLVARPMVEGDYECQGICTQVGGIDHITVHGDSITCVNEVGQSSEGSFVGPKEIACFGITAKIMRWGLKWSNGSRWEGPQ